MESGSMKEENRRTEVRVAPSGANPGLIRIKGRHGFFQTMRNTLSPAIHPPMNWLKKIPSSRRAATGLEWAIWRKLPLIFAAGTALPLAGLALLHLLAQPTALGTDPRWLQMANYLVTGVVIFHWTAVLTVGIGCVIVMVMKGPAYEADSYAVSHSDQPRAAGPDEDK